MATPRDRLRGMAAVFGLPFVLLSFQCAACGADFETEERLVAETEA